MTGVPTVLFLCVHNAGRSQMAAGWLARLAGDRVEVRSAGSTPAAAVNPVAVQAMAEVGIDIAGAQPKVLTPDAVRSSDVVITMGCGDTCPVFPGKRYEDWDLDDPAGQDLVVVRRVRDEIRARVETLVAGLLGFGVRPMREEDEAAVLAIYQAGIEEGDATFETSAGDWAAFRGSRLAEHSHVAVAGDGTVLGWVAAAPVSGRCVYSGVVEHSVYVDPPARGRGVGAALLTALIGSTEAAGVWTIQSGIFPENAASLALHAGAGFRTVGTRERLGKQHGRWRDVVLIERRSPRIG
ncbi:MAG TPA: GNAT family N-acetyltransferase [Jatrophihabitans sp.]|nr:GNAT family N-acetyltransferase [Jatrophihabitans sp.]